MTEPDPFSTLGIQQTHNLGLDTFDLAKRVLVCLSDQLALTLGGPVCRAAVYPGEEIVPMDLCCAGKDCLGMAAARVYRINPVTARYPQQDFSPRKHNCDENLFNITVELVVYRCCSVLKENGDPPTVEEVEFDARVALDDAAAMRRAVMCCFSPMADRQVEGVSLPYTQTGDYVMDDWNPVGPAGDCHGGRQRFMLPVREVGCDYVPNVVVR